MKRTTLCSILALTLVILLTACQGQSGTQKTGQASEPNSQATDSSKQTDVQSEQSGGKDVVLELVFGSVSDNKPKQEHILTGAQADFIRGLFYNHEKKVFNSPLQSITEFSFRIGDDHLNANMDFSGLEGNIAGSDGTVYIELNESESQQLYDILKPYAAFFYSFPELTDIEASIAARELDAGFRSGEITAWYQEDGSWRAFELREQAAKRVETLCTIEEIKWDSGELELPVYLLDFHNGTVVGVYRENHRGFLCKIEDRARFEAALKDGEVKPNMPGLTEAKGCIIYELYDGLVDLTK